MADDLTKFLEDIAQEEAEREAEEAKHLSTQESAHDGNKEGGQEKPVHKGARPDFRVLQPGCAINGKPTYSEVGAMWKRTSKEGREFYQLRIGNLKLLVFPNK